MGDRAVRTLLDVYEHVFKEVPSLPKVLEHGGLSPARSGPARSRWEFRTPCSIHSCTISRSG